MLLIGELVDATAVFGRQGTPEGMCFLLGELLQIMFWQLLPLLRNTYETITELLQISPKLKHNSFFEGLETANQAEYFYIEGFGLAGYDIESLV